jgi:hypothetical protein
VPYLTQYHWVNEELFAECFICDVTTLGIRSTARVESWNAVLKGAMQVSSSTSLLILFESLQFAASQVDRRNLKRALDEASRLPPLHQERTFEHDVTPHLTHHAAAKVKKQFDLSHNYQFKQKTVARADSVWEVWDRRPSTGIELRREVRVKDDFMWCSCGFPISHLLQCRHVLAINLHLYNVAFRQGQVGKRWLKYFKPVRAASQSLSRMPPPTLPSTVPRLMTSTLPTSVPLARREARYGQIMGFCMTICSRACDYDGVYHRILGMVEELAREVEGMTSRTGVDVVRPPSFSSSRMELSALHPTVPVGSVSIPEHRKKRKGRSKESRAKGAAEKMTSKRQENESLSASQMA